MTGLKPRLTRQKSLNTFSVLLQPQYLSISRCLNLTNLTFIRGKTSNQTIVFLKPKEFQLKFFGFFYWKNCLNDALFSGNHFKNRKSWLPENPFYSKLVTLSIGQSRCKTFNKHYLTLLMVLKITADWRSESRIYIATELNAELFWSKEFNLLWIK